jgi:tetratricopeptide (TPR) repeat protein
MLAAACFLALIPPSHAQLGGAGNLRIHVTYSNDRAVPRHMLVQLMNGSSSTPISTSYTNDTGMAEFSNVPVGVYHVVVSGDGIRRTESLMFEVDPRKLTQTEYVPVQRIDEEGNTSSSRDALVNAAELKIPGDAQKEFQKASEAMAHEDWNKARDALMKGINIYPQYAPAYNSLAIVYSRMNDAGHAREALQKAIVIDQRYATAYVNLGELYIRDGDYKQAQELLTKAVSIDPQNAKGLMLLADAQLLNKDYETAIATAKRAHALPHDSLALTHYICAKAYEHQNRPQDAIAELQLFLQEEPQGARADHMREEIKHLQRQVQ